MGGGGGISKALCIKEGVLGFTKASHSTRLSDDFYVEPNGYSIFLYLTKAIP